ncbi:MAG: branched-chain amino acid ABC transporter permease [Kiloniellales bacterium]|nr:branched-chain amino acid ABC transporter permease [Kiloniellales bacterium]
MDFPLTDPFFWEVVVQGLLFGGVLALLALGLNLVFGVVDVVWICYGELVMIGMYAIYYLFVGYGVPLPIAMIGGIALVACLGAVMHHFVIRPVLHTEPINQLLVTGGVLFFLQGAATLAFSVEFRNLGVSFGSFAVGEMFVPISRLLAFGISLAAAVTLFLFLKHTYLGTAVRAISEDREMMPLMGVSPRKIYLFTSALGGGLAGLGACLMALLYDVHPAIGLTFGPLTFMICVLGGLGNMIGGFIAAFIFAEFIALGGFYAQVEWGYVLAFVFFIVMMFVRPQGLFSSKR